MTGGIPIGSGISGGLAVGEAGFLVAFEVKVLDTVPTTVLVHVCDHLAAVDASNELDGLVATGARGSAAGLDRSNHGPTLANSRGVTHVENFGSKGPSLDALLGVKKGTLMPTAAT